MKKIGITGGIGTGKSTVTNYLIEKGFKVLDADKIAREIVMPGSETLEQIVEVFGNEILMEDGALNRGALGAIIFNSDEARAKLNNITFSAIVNIIRNSIEKEKGRKVIFVDAPLMFESGLDQEMDQVWVVSVDEETRIGRVMERDNSTREEVLYRINSQMKESEKLKKATEVLDNSGDEGFLYKEIDRLLTKYELY